MKTKAQFSSFALALFFCFTGCNRENVSRNSPAGVVVKSEDTIDESGEYPFVDSTQKLTVNKNQRIRLSGKYHSPGKGRRCLICEFETIGISDYSFYKMDEQGNVVSPMVELIDHGDMVEVEADLNYFAGSRTPVAGHPIVQWSPPPIEIVDGVEYYVIPPSFSLANCKLLRAVDE